MSLLTSIPFLKRTRPPRQIVSSSWNDRTHVLEDEVNLFCWERDIDSVTQVYLKGILEKNPKPIQIKVSLTNLKKEITEARQKWGAGEPETNPFWEDVYRLTYDFLQLAATNSGTLHLRIIDNNACAKFHTDGYPLRLFTTYIGEGTQWLPEVATNRAALGLSNKDIVRDPGKVNQMGSGHVGILKGELPNRPRSVKGIVHRSPEIVGSREKRIILRVDID